MTPVTSSNNSPPRSSATDAQDPVRKSTVQAGKSRGEKSTTPAALDAGRPSDGSTDKFAAQQGQNNTIPGPDSILYAASQLVRPGEATPKMVARSTQPPPTSTVFGQIEAVQVGGKIVSQKNLKDGSTEFKVQPVFRIQNPRYSKTTWGRGSDRITVFHCPGPETKPSNYPTPEGFKLVAGDLPSPGSVCFETPWHTLYQATSEVGEDGLAGVLSSFGYYDEEDTMPVKASEKWTPFKEIDFVDKVLAQPKAEKAREELEMAVAAKREPKESSDSGNQHLGDSTATMSRYHLGIKNTIHKVDSAEKYCAMVKQGKIHLSTAKLDSVRGRDQTERDELRKFLESIADDTVTITLKDGEKKYLSGSKLSHKSKVSAALAFAIQIGLNGNDLDFATVIGRMPAKGILEAASFADGRLISPACAKKVLNTTIFEMVHRRDIVRGKERILCESVSNVISRVFRDWDHSTKEEDDEHKRLQDVFDNLFDGVISRRLSDNEAHTGDPPATDPTVRNAALASGLILAGTLKYIANMQEKFDTRKRRAQLALGIALSAIGYAPIPWVAGMAGSATLAGSAIMDHFWQPPLKDVDVVFKDFVRQEVYWPLSQQNTLPKFKIGKLNSGHKAEFRDLLDLVLGSCHVLGL